MENSDKGTSPWVRFDITRWDKLLAGRSSKLFAKNAFVFQQEQESDFVFVLKSGRVRITSYQQNGTEKQFYIAETGCLFGENSCLIGSTHTSSAVAIVDSQVYCIPAADFEAAMQSDWTLTHYVLQAVCHKNSILYQQVLDLSFAQALQRITRVLLNLGLEYGEETPQGQKISIRFTHQDVANITNASRVTVSNIFNSLADEGLLKKEKGFFYLTDTHALTRYADGVLGGE